MPPSPAPERQKLGGLAAPTAIFVTDARTRTKDGVPTVIARWPYPADVIDKKTGQVKQPVELTRCQALPGQSTVMLRAYAVGMSDEQAGAFERVAAFVNHASTGGWAQLGATNAPFTASDNDGWDVSFRIGSIVVPVNGGSGTTTASVIEVLAKGPPPPPDPELDPPPPETPVEVRWSLHVTVHAGTEP